NSFSKVALPPLAIVQRKVLYWAGTLIPCLCSNASISDGLARGKESSQLEGLKGSTGIRFDPIVNDWLSLIQRKLSVYLFIFAHIEVAGYCAFYEAKEIDHSVRLAIPIFGLIGFKSKKHEV